MRERCIVDPDERYPWAIHGSWILDVNAGNTIWALRLSYMRDTPVGVIGAGEWGPKRGRTKSHLDVFIVTIGSHHASKNYKRLLFCWSLKEFGCYNLDLVYLFISHIYFSHILGLDSFLFLCFFGFILNICICF